MVSHFKVGLVVLLSLCPAPLPEIIKFSEHANITKLNPKIRKIYLAFDIIAYNRARLVPEEQNLEARI
jgi:hypothetical protein